ncbi:MAG: epoxyqueuosine reductase QueH [Firmicutes bacterium]|nr:epoxyqueuosine reductase QueH [Bacillota bacterium]
MNYQKELERLISTLDHKPTLLLHSCCAPCSSYVLEYLEPYFKITVLYYNPNIEPINEYLKRKEEQINFIKNVHPNISILDVQYDNDLYSGVVEGLEGEREGGSRCYKCYKLRIEKTASLADDKYEYFGTTLSVSPHKNANFINEIGKELEQKYNSKFLISDFKKNEGYKRSIVLSKEYNLYRQDYCGCKYSKRTD